MDKQNYLIVGLAAKRSEQLRKANSLVFELQQCLLLKSATEGHNEPLVTRVALALDRAEKYLSEVK